MNIFYNKDITFTKYRSNRLYFIIIREKDNEMENTATEAQLEDLEYDDQSHSDKMA